MANTMSRNMAMIWPVGILDAGTLTGGLLNSAFSFGVSGAYAGVHFTCPVNATYVDIYAYISAGAGSPTAIGAQIRAQDTTTATKPLVAGSVLGTPGADTNCASITTAVWVQFTRYTVNLTQGSHYFLYFVNNTGTPASNYVTFAYRAALDMASYPGLQNTAGFSTILGSDGFVGAPTTSTGMPPIVLKFSDGTLLGNPYPEGAGALTNNTNWRGNRFVLERDMTVTAIVANISGVTQWIGGTWAIYQGANALRSGTIDLAHQNGTTIKPMWFAPIALRANTPYDVVLAPGSATTSNPANQMALTAVLANTPADVQACGIYGVTFVTGATPGSFTETPQGLMRLALVVDSMPPIRTYHSNNATMRRRRGG
jgi:hypothetical protein